MRTQVAIKINESVGTSFDFRELTPPEVINLSKPLELFNNKNPGARGFQLSASKNAPVSDLSGDYGYFASTGYSGYISKALSNSSGAFVPALSINFYIESKSPKYLYIVFDPVAAEYATHFSVAVGSKSVWVGNNESASCRVDLSELNLQTHSESVLCTLTIHNWSRANASVKITSISSAYFGVFTGKDLKSFTCSENTHDEQLNRAPGVIAQYADVSIYDRHGILHELANEGTLLSEAEITIEAIDHKGASTTLGSYRASTWDVQATSSVVSVECTDITDTLEDLHITQQPIVDRTLHDMLELLFQNVRNASWVYYDKDTEKYCKSIMTPNNWFRSGSLHSLLNKICSLGMLRIYWYINTYVVVRCW